MENTTIIIEDDGVAQDPKALEQVAQRGVRLDESVEGHGLGLAICKDIIKLYTGTIHFGHSEKLGGFKVEMNIPLYPIESRGCNGLINLESIEACDTQKIG